MSETMMRVTNISDRERSVSWDGMPYAIPPSGRLDVSPVLAQHFQKRHKDAVTLQTLTLQHVAPEAAPQTRLCPTCKAEFTDLEEFLGHVAPCAIAAHEAAKPAPLAPEPELPRIIVTLRDGAKPGVEVSRDTPNHKVRVRLDSGGEFDVPEATVKPAPKE